MPGVGRSNGDLIARSLGHGPDVEIGGQGQPWHFARWRSFVGTYVLPALVDPAFIVHFGGKQLVRTRDGGTWHEVGSVPGLATIVPPGRPTELQIDGELDAVTLSISAEEMQQAPGRQQFERIHYAFCDTLGVALTKQILAELYRPAVQQRHDYLAIMIDALKAHILNGPLGTDLADVPTSLTSPFRVHRVIEAIREHPAGDHSVENMAMAAGVSPWHFSRVFRQATGYSPHRFVLKVRLDRALVLLANPVARVAEVASLLGFVNASHFTRLFREYTGQSPREWRKTRHKG